MHEINCVKLFAMTGLNESSGKWNEQKSILHEPDCEAQKGHDHNINYIIKLKLALTC